MKRKIFQASKMLILVCVLLTNAIVFGQTKRAVDFKETTLKNGLRVITVEDRSAPVITLAITYDVGSRNERKGRTGFAHFFEHMMFKGSENVGNGEHYTLVFNNGGAMNGTTNKDRTNYYNVLPSNQLEMTLFLEADRMRSLDINQANFDNQRQAVKEERRLRVDNVAYGISDEKIEEVMYDNFAYKHSIIGSMDDLDAAKVEDVQEFFKMYYAPNNAVLTLVGDFNTQDALAKIRKYFENIPSQPKPPTVDMTEPQQTTERRGTHEDGLARSARLDIAFKSVAGNTPDFYALQVLSSILQSGQSSRFAQKIVREKALVTSISGSMDERRGVGAFNISATVRPDKTPELVEAAIYEEIELIKKSPIADWELQKAKNNTKRNYLNSLQSSLARAVNLGQYAVFYNDPNLINTRLDRINAVTTQDVQRVANKYFQSANRTVLVTLPKAKTGGGVITGQQD